jgi:hypothetical protein
MKKILAIAALSALSLPAFAQGYHHRDDSSTPRIDQRQANQERRIQEGLANGTLTRHEAARLERGQARIRQMERRALANGRMTPYERAEIERAQDQQSRRIAQLTHDRDYSYNGYRY